MNYSHGKSNTRIYKQWRSIKERCLLVNNKSYKNYGGRGIKVCDIWKDSFINYFEWAMLNGYTDDLTIDRINNDGNYEPDNCRFVSMSIQARNTQKLKSNNTTGYRGVTRYNGGWVARIMVDYKSKYIGKYNTAQEASIAYDDYIKKNNLEHTRNDNV